MDHLAAWRPLLAGLVVLLAGLVVRRILFRRLTRWVWSDIAIRVLWGPFLLWCLIAAIYVVVVTSPVGSESVRLAGTALSILWVLSLTLVALRLADQGIQRYGMKLAATLPLTSLTQHLAKGAILVVGGLIILNGLGVSITPFLTALGIGGLAVALGLQDTLTNLFSGIYIIVARQIRVGDYIRLEGGEEGTVVDIGWRSTRIRTLANNLIVVPNSKLAQLIVTNFDLPSRELAVLVELKVDYRGEIESVERAIIEVGREVMREVPGGVPAFDPFIRYHTLGDAGLHCTVILRAQTFVDQYLIKHEFIKRLHRRYTREGMAVFFPMRQMIVAREADS